MTTLRRWATMVIPKGANENKKETKGRWLQKRKKEDEEIIENHMKLISIAMVDQQISKKKIYY